MTKMDQLVLEEMCGSLEQARTAKDFDIVKWNKEYDATANRVLVGLKNSVVTDTTKFKQVVKETNKSLRFQLEKIEIYSQFNRILTTTKTLESVTLRGMFVKYIQTYLELYELRKIREVDEAAVFKKYTDVVKYHQNMTQHDNLGRLTDIVQHLIDLQSKPDLINDRIKQILIPIGLILDSNDEDDIAFLAALADAIMK